MIGFGMEAGAATPPQLAQLLEGRDEQAQARPLDERDQDVDLVGGSHLRREFTRHLRVARRTGEERRLGDRRLGPHVARRKSMRRRDLDGQGPGVWQQGSVPP